MKIYRIYKYSTLGYYNGYTDDYDEYEEDVTIKYVSSKEKVDAFLEEKEQYNKSCHKCYECPIMGLTKRKYNNRKNEVDAYCDKKDLVYTGNYLYCRNEKTGDFTEYYYEEIDVEE